MRSRNLSNSQSSNELTYLSIHELAPLIRQKRLSPVELAEHAIDRVDRFNGHLKAFITFTPELSLAAAQQANREIKTGQYRGPLHGIPIAHKDIFCTAGVLTTGHSQAFIDFVPNHDADLVTAWGRAGAVCLGKANTYELSAGREQDLFGTPVNPWKQGRVTGGSSSGSAGGLAAGLFYGASGTDNGGSIRAPAAFCGVVGFRPTFGLVSTKGLLAGGWSSLNCAGPMARSVADVALLMQPLVSEKSPYAKRLGDWDPTHDLQLEPRLANLRVGVPEHYFLDPARISHEVLAAVGRVITLFEDLGAEIRPVAMPHVHLAGPAHRVIATAESAATLGTLTAKSVVKLGRLTRVTLEASKRLTARQLVVAQQLRQLVSRDFHRAFEQVDFIVSPTTVDTAQVPIDDLKQPSFPRPPASLAGVPALSLPCGLSSEGLPIGVQLMGPRFRDWSVLQAGWALEHALPKMNWPEPDILHLDSAMGLPSPESSLEDAVGARLESLISNLNRAVETIDLNSVEGPCWE